MSGRAGGTRVSRRRGAEVPRVRTEGGGGTVLMVAVCGVVMVLGYTAMIIAGYAIAAHRARAVADLAALSAATVASQGGDACSAARGNARAQRAEIVACDRVGDQIDFVVSVTARVDATLGVPGLPRQIAAVAHAGSEEVR